MASIEELAFELAEEHTSGNLEKLIKYLDLLINGKRSQEAPQNSTPAKAAPASKAKNAKASEPSDDDETF